MTTIGVFAASHSFFEDPYQAGLSWLRARGFDVVESPTLRARHRYFAGTDAERLAGFLTLARDPSVDVLWAARGGSGILRIVDQIPWADLPPKRLIGFSDVTPLLEAAAHAGWSPWHGPVIHSIAKTDSLSLELLVRALNKQAHSPLRGARWADGDAAGPLVGGNLCLLAAACGTPQQLDARGAILMLEEIGESPYKVDRMLTQLSAAGVLDGVAGIGLGSFTGCDPPPGTPWTLDDVLREHLLPLGVPVLASLPFGHGARNDPWPVRRPGRMSADELTWDE